MMAGKPGFLSFSSLAGTIATVAPNPRSLSLPPVHPPCHYLGHPREAKSEYARPSASCPDCRIKSRLFSRNQIGLLPSSRTISCHFPVPLMFFTLVPSDNLQIPVGVWSLLGKLGWAAFKGITEHGGWGLSHSYTSQSRECPEESRKSRSGKHIHHRSLGPGA